MSTPKHFDITITMVMVIMKMLKKILYINKVDWTFHLSSRLHFLGFYKLKKHYRAWSVKRNFSGLAVEGSGMPMYLKKNPLRQIFPWIHAEYHHLGKQGILYYNKRNNFGVKIPYSRFKVPLYSVFLKTLTDPDLWISSGAIAILISFLKAP